MRRINYRLQTIFCTGARGMDGRAPVPCDNAPVYQVVSDRGRVDSPPLCARHARQWCDKANSIETALAAARGTK